MRTKLWLFRSSCVAVTLLWIGCAVGRDGEGPTGGSGHGGGATGASELDPGGKTDAHLAPDTLPLCHPGPPCPEGWFAYTDQVCYFPPEAGCALNGNGLCYQTCKTDSDCTDPRFPTCGGLNFYHGSDWGHLEPACLSKGELPRCPSTTDGGP